MSGQSGFPSQLFVSHNKYTNKTILDIEELRAQLKKVAKEEVGYDRGEYLDGMIALAVPVTNDAGEVCYSIAVHAPSARISIEELETYLPQLNEAARKMSELESKELG